jgi:DNA repair protein RecO
MNQVQTIGIVLSRIDYGEADRIVTMLTPDQGKLSLMARGVRKPKSKLAGGIELFSISDISFIQGRGSLATLVSTRLKKHFGQIITDINRVQLGYDLIKKLNKTTEDQPEAEYFMLLSHVFSALDDDGVNLDLINAWFLAQLLKQAGHTPNLITDSNGQKLSADQNYNFDVDAVGLTANDQGSLKADQIKIFRLLFSDNKPEVLERVQGISQILPSIQPYLNSVANTYLRI